LNILDIANSFDSLGEKISDENLVRKILSSLSKRFDMKVTAIEEAQDISSLKVDELIGSLQNFDITVNDKTNKKGKVLLLFQMLMKRHKEIKRMMKACQRLLCYLEDSLREF
jgi:hypothetical protein